MAYSRVQLYVRTFYTDTQWDTAGRRVASANVEFIDAYRFDGREWIGLDHPIVAGGYVGEIEHPSLFKIRTFEPWMEDPHRQESW